MNRSDAEARAHEVNAALTHSKFLAYPRLDHGNTWCISVSEKPQIELQLDPVQQEALVLEDSVS